MSSNSPHVLYKSTDNNDEDKADIIVNLENIQKTYLLGVEGVPALRGVSVNIKKGEFVIIYGTSGGGKTSLLNIIGTIDRPTKGRLTICSDLIRERTRDEKLASIRLQKMGFVFQTFNLLSTMTALENVEMPMILKGKLSRRERKKRAKELLRSVGMGARMNHVPSQLSGGEQQRVTIARACANQPDILLLDEPTGDLDSHNTRVVMDLLEKLNREQGMTMIMVTHDPNLKNSAHRIIWMRDGKIAKIENISESTRSQFWNDLREQLNGDTQNTQQEESESKPTNKMQFTEIRQPSDYATLLNCLPQVDEISKELLNQSCETEQVLIEKEKNQKSKSRFSLLNFIKSKTKRSQDKVNQNENNNEHYGENRVENIENQSTNQNSGREEQQHHVVNIEATA